MASFLLKQIVFTVSYKTSIPEKLRLKDQRFSWQMTEEYAVFLLEKKRTKKL
jgi:hypothetical protein